MNWKKESIHYWTSIIDLGPNSICLGVKDQEKLRSAAEVILSSSISVVSCSSNVDFRTACLNSMKVWDKNNFKHVYAYSYS